MRAVGRAIRGAGGPHPTTDAPDDHRRRAVDAFAAWLTSGASPPTDDQRLANQLADLIDDDPTIARVDEVADALDVSVRTLQRLARTHVGLTPSAMIRRRRLQGAADRIRTDPEVDLAALAAELGYADHAHLTREFRSQLGFTPTGYRRDLADPPESSTGGGGERHDP